VLDTDTLIAIGFGGVLGALLTLMTSFIYFKYTNRVTSEQDKETSLRNLLWEMEQNESHQETSFLIPLDDEAYSNLRQRGWLTGLDARTQNLLMKLYSFIQNKNGLVAVYLNRGEGVSIGKENPLNILDVIQGLSNKINASLIDLIILLRDKLGIRRS
jgi:hypothetical protein